MARDVRASLHHTAQRPTLFDSPAYDATLDFWKGYLTGSLGYPKPFLTPITTGILGVYRDPMKSRCLGIICDGNPAQDRSLAEVREIAQRYEAELVVLGSPSAYVVYQVGMYSLASFPGSRLPSWTPGLRRTRLLTRDHVLLPFRDEEQLRKAFTTCHDAIYTESASDPAAAFDLLSLIVAAKVMDEQDQTAEWYEFSEIIGEGAGEAADRLTELLKRARRWLVGEELADGEIRGVPKLGPGSVSAIFRQFQDFSLTLTSDSARGTDILGVAYERMVGATFRGELGSYFTPSVIADFMVRLLDIRAGRVLDPSCGSGGLLVAAHRYARSLGADAEPPDLYGNDINPRMVEAAKINFLVHRHDPARVIRGDGLQAGRMLDRWFAQTPPECDEPLWDILDGPFDAVVANPPFAGHEKNLQVLRQFQTARRRDGSIRSLNKALPFLELIVAVLREGGRAGVVIPTSILNAEEDSFVKFRQLLLGHVEIRAIIGLPEKAFVHTDCGVHGALLFFERRRQPRQNYDVFVGWADEVGYDRLGRPSSVSDFPSLLERYRSSSWNPGERMSIRDLIEYERWDPAWLRVAHTLPTTDSEKFVALTEIMEVRNARRSKKRANDAPLRYFEVNDTDIRTGEVKSVHSAPGPELAKKGRIRNQVRSGDILLPNHRDSLMAAGANNGRPVVVVDASLDGVLTTDRFMVVRPKIDPLLLVAILNSRGVRRQLIAQCRGAASLDVRERMLGNVLVPRSLLEEPLASAVPQLAHRVTESRRELDENVRELEVSVDAEFECDLPIRPPAAK